MKIGCCIGPERLEKLETAGYDFIDLPGGVIAGMDGETFLRAAERLDRGRLRCEGFHASVPGSVPLAGPSCDEKTADAYFDILCRRASRLGCPRIGIGSPAARNIAPGTDRRAHVDTFVRVFAAAARKAAGYGIELLLEALAPEFSNFLNTMDETAAVLDRAGEPNTSLVLDIFHFIETGESPDALTPDIVRRIKYLHIAEPGGRRYPRPDNIEIYRPVLSRLRSLGCRADMITIEAPGDDFDANHEASLRALRNLF